MVDSSVQTETRQLYGWVIGISVRFGNKFQVKNLYAWVKMIKGGKKEMHEQSTLCNFLYVFMLNSKKRDIQIRNFICSLLRSSEQHEPVEAFCTKNVEATQSKDFKDALCG